MGFEELLELKKEVDELSLYYAALKKRQKEVDELFYSNNLLELDDADDDYDVEETIEKKIKEGYSSYAMRKMVGYWFRYALLVIAQVSLDVPSIFFTCLIVTNLVYYMTVVFSYEKIMRFKLETEEEPKHNYEALIKEKGEVDKCLEYVRDKYCSLSAKYEEIVSRLDASDYEEYLEYISEYLQYMLENSDELLSEAQENCKIMAIEDGEDKDDDYTYRLN